MNESIQKKPEIIVFAGPNGSGKSSLTNWLQPKMLYIKADEIKKQNNCSDMAAAKTAESIREFCLSLKEDFCFETVMSTDRNLKLLQRAKNLGYFIRCYYVLTVDPIINVLRVQSRVSLGGHNVPVEKIISRYEKSLKLVSEVVKISDICHIYDNSTNVTFRIFKKRKAAYFYDECEDWKLPDIQRLTGIRNICRKNLNL